MRAITVDVPDVGEVRAYAAADVARAFGVTTKTVVAWTGTERVRGPRLAGWAPRTVAANDRRWLIAADDVDRELAARGDEARASPVEAEKRRLADERQLLDLERAVFLSERTEQLESDNARLRDEVARLRSQIAALGQAIHDLTVAP